jgi:hypothetical protein
MLANQSKEEGKQKKEGYFSDDTTEPAPEKRKLEALGVHVFK